MPRIRRTSGKTLLSETQRELHAREEKVRRKVEQLQSLINQAPGRAEEVRKREREHMIERANTDISRSDPFHYIGEETRRKTRHNVSLKGERNAERTQFILLLLLLAVICLIVLSRLPK